MLLNVIPDRYKELSLNDLDTFFAMARGYQGEKGDVKALAMKKWFNTNYHYLVPEFYDNTKICLANRKPLEEYAQAKNYGIETKPVLIGAFTFLKLARYCENKKLEDFVEDVIKAYIAILESFDTLSVSWVQFDEPILVTDLTKEDILIFTFIYEKILERKGNVKILLQTYFGDVRDCYQELIKLDFDGIGLDFVEGKKSLELIKRYGFPKEKRLFAGIVNGKNIWKCNYHKALVILKEIKEVVNHIAISTSCSLLHVPYTIENETKLDLNILKYFAFAKEKLIEIKELGQLANQCDFTKSASYLRNQEVFRAERVLENKQVLEGVHELSEKDFIRKPSRCVRQQLQKEKLKLPFLPTTTIGSFPQTIQVKQNRLSFRKGGISRQEYDANIQSFIKDCIELQEELGFDVFVHGEFERNDMVEFFGENLEGYLFTEKAWVLSYGTRCVKPPIIFGDVKRTNPITVSYAEYANQLTQKPVKGMLTGPVTILNWSFPREDISLSEMAFQIALAIREEVLDLEKAGVKIIQIDEAALK
jgi:5-methyltetrahydropteroyltriglutamate--homocysteine methyltransferase